MENEMYMEGIVRAQSLNFLGKSGGMIPQKILELSTSTNPFVHFWAKHWTTRWLLAHLSLEKIYATLKHRTTVVVNLLVHS